jgi:DNA gyrase/topoisomerase IV subunit A
MTTQNEATNPTAASNLIAEKTPLEDAKAKLLEQLNGEDIQEEEREQLMAEIALMSSQISDIDKRLDKAQKEREKSEKKAQTEAQAKLSCETGEAKALMEAVRADIQTKSNFSGLLIAAAAACYNIQGFYMVFAQVEAEYKAAEEPVPAVIRKNKSLIKWGFENDELFFKSGQKQGTLRGISQIEKAKKSKTAPKEEGEEQTGSAGRASGSNGGESKTTDGIEIPKSLLGIVGRFETITRVCFRPSRTMGQPARSHC